MSLVTSPVSQVGGLALPEALLQVFHIVRVQGAEVSVPSQGSNRRRTVILLRPSADLRRDEEPGRFP